MALSDAFMLAFGSLIVLTMLVLLVAVFLPREKRRKVLQNLKRKWTI